jgi:hypothetical protein
MGSQQEVALSQDILIPKDGYAGPGASLVEKQTSEQLELVQKQKNRLSRLNSQQLSHIRDIQRDMEEARTKLLVQVRVTLN